MKVRQVLLVIFGGILLVVLAVFGLAVVQSNQERASLSADLEIRTGILADSLKESIEPYYLANSRDSQQNIIDKFTNREHLVGLAIYDGKGVKIATSADLSPEIVDENKAVFLAMDTDKPAGTFIKNQDGNFYVYVTPLHQLNRVAGAFAVFQDANYIETNIWQIFKKNLFRVLTPVFLFFLIIVVLIWLVIYRPLKGMVESVRSARIGKPGGDAFGIKDHGFFKPLVREISKMTRSLSEARSSASEEARMRLEKLDTPWTAERLKEFVKAYLKDQKIFLISNREPYIHSKVKNQISYSVPASGMVTALEPVMEACGGMWLAYGSGNADKETVDAKDKIQVPPDDQKYTLKRIWLTDEEVKGFYVGFSNEALWPLCLMAHTRPIFSRENWEEYCRVNEKFAKSLLEEIKDVQHPIILVQDYHFALLPKIVKVKRPDAQICLFWHIPWPNAERFSICPQRKEILEGMLGADVIGFHTQQYCNNFMDTVGNEMESLINLEQFSISKDGHISFIKPFPISIAFTNSNKFSEAPNREEILKKFNIKTKYLGLGVDRLDYVKGILERFKGVEFFLDNHPDYKKKFTFLQIAPLSREGVKNYNEYAEAVKKEAERINKKIGVADWQPIVLETKHHTHEELEPLYRLADVCLVTSLHDGMNLVAKEFVAARDDNQGVLILSYFTGASRDLKGATMVNPYSAEQMSEAIYEAIVMPSYEQRRRMKMMRSAVKNYNIYRWSVELIKSVADLG